MTFISDPFVLRYPQHGQIQHMADYPELDVAEANWIDQDEFIPRS